LQDTPILFYLKNGLLARLAFTFYQQGVSIIMIRNFILIIFLIIDTTAIANDSIRVLFVYGSRPIDKVEDKWFGGIHGGHVSVSYQNGFASFIPASGIQIFDQHTINSKFTCEYGNQFVFDTTDSRYLIISIPADSCQYNRLDSCIREFVNKSPYAYTFFGMRCASAAYHLLSLAGVLPELKQSQLWRRYFYPKLLRKELIKMARQNAWPMVYRSGRTSRHWEKDDLQPN
jgi:hypothetical protein